VGVDGIDKSNVGRLKEQASKALEEVRLERIAEAATKPDLPTEKERLVLVRGVTDRIADQLERGGYGNLLAIMKEMDVDRFAIRTRIPHEQAQLLKKSIEAFVKEDWPRIEAGVVEAKKVEMARIEKEEAEELRLAEEAAAAAALIAESAPEAPEGATLEAGPTDAPDPAPAGEGA
jgi:hypothetical protein